MGGDGMGMSAARAIARERAGRRREGESEADYGERVREASPHAEPAPWPTTDGNAVSRRTEREQRSGVVHRGEGAA